MIQVAPTSCPCCGQAIKDSPLMVSLEFNTLICGDQAIEVTPTQAELLFVLRKYYPNNVPIERLIPAVWGHKRPSENVIRTMICTSRKILEKVQHTIRNSRGEGYRVAKL